MNLVLLLNVAVQDLDVQATQDMQVPIYYSIKLILEVFVDLSVLKDLIFALPIKYHTLWGMKSFQPQLN